MAGARKAVFNVFNPQEALGPKDPRYVDFSRERGSEGILDTLASTIQLAEESTCQLFCGHRGSGKTTELFRLRERLLHSSPPHFTVYCESDKYVDLNDVEYTDVLLAILQQLWIDAAAAGIRLDPGKLYSFFDELKNVLLSPVSITKMEFGIGLAKLVAEIKNNATNRQQVREHLRPRTTSFLEAVNEVIGRAREEIQRKAYGGLTVIVDNLDRVYRNALPNLGRTTHDTLFIDSADHLRSLACDVVYTIPTEVLYSPHGPRLAALFGYPPQILPMVPVARRDGVPDNDGRAKLIEALRVRVAQAAVSDEDAFDSPATMERLASASGGFLRGLMTLARTSLSFGTSLPINLEAVEHAIRTERNRLDLSLRTSNAWTLLRRVSETKKIFDSDEYLSLLENYVVMGYLDQSGPWHDVNPIVKESKEF